MGFAGIGAPIVSSNEIITGERLQSVADVAILTEGKREFHKSIPDMPLAYLGANMKLDDVSLSRVKTSRVIFVYAEFVDVFFSKILPALSAPFVLVSHNGDTNIGEKYRHVLEDERILRWFAQNVLIEHPKLTALPIGLANAQWPHGDTASLVKEASVRRDKRQGLYMNFSLTTNEAVRRPIYEALERRPFTFTAGHRKWKTPIRKSVSRWIRRSGIKDAPMLAFSQYLAEMAEFGFSVAPPGNGLDCHRTWEALYLGVVPVVAQEESPVLQGLPHVAFSDLTKVTMDKLCAGVGSFRGPFAWNRLHLSYWRSAIRLAAQEG